MPLIKSAIKKMRQDKKRTQKNRQTRDALKKVIKEFEAKPNSENLVLAFSSLDRAAKNGLIPKGRASRKKARLSVKVKGSTATAKATKTKSSPKKTRSVEKS